MVTTAIPSPPTSALTSGGIVEAVCVQRAVALVYSTVSGAGGLSPRPEPLRVCEPARRGVQA